MFLPYASVWSVSRLSREDWASAALDEISSRGLAAVAVEPLAVKLGTTKGIFYWHFPSRDDLIVAALALWQKLGTASVISRLEADAEPPAHRLRRLFTLVFAAEARTDADLALLADADHPLVAPVLAAATSQRLDYVRALFVELGFAPETARRRALLAYSAYLGQLQMLRSAPGLLPEQGAAGSAYADEVLAVLLR